MTNPLRFIEEAKTLAKHPPITHWAKVDEYQQKVSVTLKAIAAVLKEVAEENERLKNPLLVMEAKEETLDTQRFLGDCPTCGSSCVVETRSDGTSYFVPKDTDVQELRERLAEAIEALKHARLSFSFVAFHAIPRYDPRTIEYLTNIDNVLEKLGAERPWL